MNGATVDFALTRFEAVDGARLEVEGTWSGVRGVRFVRPALVVHGATGGEKTLLADLEHKPWPAAEGETWVAAFPWTGSVEPDVARTELAVAPSIVVPLARPGVDAAPGPRPELPPVPAQAARDDAPPPARAERDPADALRAELAAARERLAALDAEVARLRRERENAGTELEGLRAELRTQRAEPSREATRGELRQRDEAVAARDAALAARDAAIEERDRALGQRDELRRALQERDAAAEGASRRREQALEERDAARRELHDAQERA